MEGIFLFGVLPDFVEYTVYPCTFRELKMKLCIKYWRSTSDRSLVALHIHDRGPLTKVSLPEWYKITEKPKIPWLGTQPQSGHNRNKF